VPHIFGQRPVGVLQDAGVVAQAWIDVARAASERIDREVGCEGERPLLEPL
jgi:hypothetical protein